VSDRENDLRAFTCRVYSIGALRYTPGGDAVCNARTNVAGKLGDEWHPEWVSVTAWGEAADELAACSHGDDVILRDARLTGNAYKAKDGTLVTEVAIHANKVERVGAIAPPPQQTQPEIDPASVPF
jgi:single-stranded DNA-binding protein